MSSRFVIHTPQALAELHVIERQAMGDSRGWLERMFCTSDLADLLGQRSIQQINLTHTAERATVRGMHFQHPPHAEMKLVSCLRGEVFDVAVDLRPDSPTRYQWHGEILSAENHKTFVIPEGFAHGFQTLMDDCEMLYYHTAAYDSAAEGGAHPLDPDLAIKWPLPIGTMSARDASHPYVKLA